MKKEEILAKSREENRDEDERERYLRKGSAVAAFVAMGLTGVVLMFAEAFFLETELLLHAVPLMLHMALCLFCWYRVAISKKKAVWIFCGIVWIFNIALSAYRVIETFIEMMG